MKIDRRRVIAVIGLLVGIIGGAVFLSRSPLSHKVSGGSHRVAIFSYVSHPVLNEVQAAAVSTLQDLAGSSVLEFSYFSADGNDAAIAPLTDSILGNSYELVIPISTPVSRQLVQRAPQDLPIVYSFVTNPPDLGAARLEKNVTGVSDAVNYPANVDLMLAMTRGLQSIGMLYNPAELNSLDALRQARPLFEARSVTVIASEVSSSRDISTAAQAIAPLVQAFYVGGDNTVVGAMPELVRVADQHNKPVFASDSGSVEKGAVAAVSVNYTEIGVETAKLAWSVLSLRVAPRDLSPVSVSGRSVYFNPARLSQFGMSLPEASRGSAIPIGN